MLSTHSLKTSASKNLNKVLVQPSNILKLSHPANMHIRPHNNNSTSIAVHAPHIVRPTIAIAIVVHSSVDKDAPVVPAVIIGIEGSSQELGEVE